MRQCLAAINLIIVFFAAVFMSCSSSNNTKISPPLDLKYGNGQLEFPVNMPVRVIPTVKGIVKSYEIDSPMPPGLTFNTSTGVISGTPTAFQYPSFYKVTASNESGSASVSFSMAVGTKYWTRLLGSYPDVSSTIGASVAEDPDEKLYVAGMTNNPLGEHVQKGKNDLFLVKYSTYGNDLWLHQLGAPDNGNCTNEPFEPNKPGCFSCGKAVVYNDSDGFIYVGGYATGDFEGLTRVGVSDIILLKFDTDGNLIWKRQHGAEGVTFKVYGMVVGSAGDLFMTGMSDGTIGGKAVTGDKDMFVAKFSRTTGDLEWMKYLGAAGKDTCANSITALDDGSVFVGGYTNGALEGQTLNGTKDMFISRYDANGSRLALWQFGVNGASTEANAVTSDGKDILYITGSTEGPLDGKVLAGDGDMFIIKYDIVKNIRLWTRLLGNRDLSTNGSVVSYNPDGGVFVSGVVGNLVGGGVDGQSPTGNLDLFMTKYDENGLKLWTRQIGSNKNCCAYLLALPCMVLNQSMIYKGEDTFVMAGATTGDLDDQTHSRTVTFDMFLMKRKFDISGSPQGLLYPKQTYPGHVSQAFTATDQPTIATGENILFGVEQGLPAGLSIDPVTGIISGTPTEAPWNMIYTVTASNTNGAVGYVLKLDIIDYLPIVSYSGNPYSFILGEWITPVEPSWYGGKPLKFETDELPAGLSLNELTGILGGTPSRITSSDEYAVNASNTAGSTTVDLSITVNPIAHGKSQFGYRLAANESKICIAEGNSNALIKVICSSDGAAWTEMATTGLPAELFASPTGGDFGQSLAIDSVGNLYLVWRDGGADNATFVYKWNQTAGAWSTLYNQNFGGKVTGLGMSPKIVLGPGNVPYILTYNESYAPAIYTPLSGQWTEIKLPKKTYTGKADIFADNTHLYLAVSSTADPDYDTVYALHYDGSSWSFLGTKDGRTPGNMVSNGAPRITVGNGIPVASYSYKNVFGKGELMTTPFVNDDWDSMASTGILTQERAFIAGYFDILAIGGTVYLVAGYDGKIIRYNSTNISWDTIATFTGTNNGSIWSAYFKGKIYVFNGSPNDGSPPFVRSFDP